MQEYVKSIKKIGVFSTLWDGVKAFGTNIKLIIGIMFVVYLPMYIILGFFKYNLTSYSIAINILDFIVGNFVLVLITFAIAKGSPEMSTSLLKVSFKRFPIAIAAITLLYITSMVLSVLAVIPGIIFFMFSSYSVYITIIDDKKFLGAIKHSWMIVKRHFFKVALVKVLFVATGVLNFVIVYHMVKNGFGIHNRILSYAVGILNEFIAMFIIVLDIALYLNLEKENALFIEGENIIDDGMDLEVKPLVLKSPKYPMLDEILDADKALSTRKGWKILRYVYAIMLIVGFSLSLYKELKYEKEDIRAYVENSLVSSDENEIQTFLIISKSPPINGLFAPTPERLLLLERAPLLVLSKVESSKNIAKAYWVINTIPDGKIKNRIINYVITYILR